MNTLRVSRHTFNQYEERESSRKRRLVGQVQVLAHSKEQSVMFVKDIHGRDYWYEYLGVEASNNE